MAEAAVFKSNRNQAIRMPKAMEFPEGVKRVDIIQVGESRVITPAGKSWDAWFDGESVSADFMSGREQPDDQEREGF